ncbi:hypothetical protein IAD21_00031 [Abditibacteriota bacterium]|nr:hypothetical protein IAD21_00031 [Abditibacteriota bacterium]
MQTQQPIFLSRNKAFTLIELLVVIAIIAILAAILFPVFARARENSRRSVCQSNLKQIGLAITQYSQDYDERFPIGNYYSGDATTGNIPWMEIVNPYTAGGYKGGTGPNAGKTVSIYVCPSYAFSDPQNIIQRPSNGYPLNYWLTKFYGSIGTGGVVGNTPEWNAPPVSIASVQEASRVVLTAEGSGGRVTTTGNDIPDGQSGAATDTGNITTAIWKGFGYNYVTGRDRHFGGSNYLFVDGHVKWVKAPDPSYTGTITYNTGVTPATADITTVTPNKSINGVVYRRADNPNALGYFLEN